MKQARKYGKGLLAIVFGVALAGSTLLVQAADQTMEGTISDAMCGAKHKMADGKKCTMGCAKSNGYALVVGDKVYKLSGMTDELTKLAGDKAKVTGAVDGMNITVSSVAAAM